MNLRYWIPLGIISAWFLLALVSPWLALQSDMVSLTSILKTPSTTTWLGNDDLGRPVLDRLISGAATSLFVSFMVVVISLVFGSLIGTFAAWKGGWVDHVLTRIIDVFLAFPGVLLAIALSGILGPGIGNVILALSIMSWVGYARLARAQTLSLKHREHILAAKALGTSNWNIIRWHLLPLMMAPLIVEATFGIAGVIIAEAGLSFLGLGVQPPDASWGSMIRDGTRYLLVAPHLILFPSLALIAIVLSVNLLGDQLRDKLDVHSK